MLPTFKTRRLLLRQRTVADTWAVVDVQSDADVRRFLNQPPREPEADAAVIAEETERHWGSGLGFWSVVAQHDQERYLGWIVLIPLHGRGPETEIGWCFARPHWGRGFASEAAACILRHGFETIRLPEIVAAMHPDNERSARLASRLGMALDRERSAARGGLFFRLSAEAFTRSALSAGRWD